MLPRPQKIDKSTLTGLVQKTGNQPESGPYEASGQHAQVVKQARRWSLLREVRLAILVFWALHLEAGYRSVPTTNSS